MDSFKRRAQIFAHEFKLDDSKFFVNALEATMRSVHLEAIKWEPYRPENSKHEKYITEDRLKRFKGIVKIMQYEHKRHTPWSYQKRGNLLRINAFVIEEIENLWKDQSEHQNEKHSDNCKKDYTSLLTKYSKTEHEIRILKEGWGIEPVYYIKDADHRKCFLCRKVSPNDGTFFEHASDCKFMVAVNLI